MGASVRRVSKVLGQRADLCPDLYPVLVRHLIGGRLSIFSILDVELGQRFSLDNGMALQDTMDLWLRRYRPPRLPIAHDVFRLLKKHREPLNVLWEGRDLRIWTWPMEMKPEVINVVRRILQVVSTGVGMDQKPCIGEEHR